MGSEVKSGTVYTVGNGEVYGEVGLKDVPEVTYPICVDGLEYEPIVDIQSSSLHTLALNEHGQIWSWGCNDFGALGRSGEENVPAPIEHASVKYIKFIKIACGNSISMAINSKGLLYSWGSFRSKAGIARYLPHIELQTYPRIVAQLSKLNIVDIAAGAAHCLALSDQGLVYSWGCGEYGHLGRDAGQNLNPTQISDLKDIVSVFSGDFHSFAINKQGQLFAWGYNNFGQCGLIEEGNILQKPTLIPYFSKLGQEIKQNKKRDKGKGKANYQDETINDIIGRLTISDSDKNEEPTNGEKQPNVIKSISAGECHTLVLLQNNHIVVFGRCDGGQLGIVLYPNYNYPGAIKVNDLIIAVAGPMKNSWRCEETITKIVCGANHSLVITEKGLVYGFGQSSDCRLGLYDVREDVYFPTLIKSIDRIGRVINASAGDRFTMFVLV